MNCQEQLETIRRICNAQGIRVERLNAVEAVKLLAREYAARGAMVRVLERQDNQRLDAKRAVAGMYTSEPIPGRPSALYAGDQYFADEEDARRARLDLDAAQREQVRKLVAASVVNLAEQVAREHVA